MKLFNQLIEVQEERILRINKGSILDVSAYDRTEPEFVVYIHKEDENLYREVIVSYDPDYPLCPKCGGDMATAEEIECHSKCEWEEYDEVMLLNRLNISLENSNNVVTIKDIEGNVYILSSEGSDEKWQK